MLAGRRPALERGAVDPSLVIQRHGVAELRRPIDRHQRRRLFAHGLEGSLELFVGCGLRLRLQLDPGVVFHFDGRPDRNDRAEPQRRAVFFGHEFHLRPGDRLELVFVDGLRVFLRHKFFERLIDDSRGPILLLVDLARDLARPESRHFRRPDELLICRVGRGAELLGRDADLEFDLGRVELLQGRCGHGCDRLLRRRCENGELAARRSSCLQISGAEDEI